MRNCLWCLVAVQLAACAHSEPPSGEAEAHGFHRRFDDAEAWAKRFEDPSRDAWQRPDEVIRLLALPPDAKVADIGSATGYFAVRLARALPQGRVYGVDIETSMVSYLTKRAEREAVGNLTTVLGAPDDARLPEAVDLVMVMNVYHHVEQRTAYFAKLREKVKPGGRLAVIDFTKRSTMGPPPGAKVDPATVTAELTAAGWKPLGSFDALPEQYFLLFGR